jgi:hypothetical protein
VEREHRTLRSGKVGRSHTTFTVVRQERVRNLAPMCQPDPGTTSPSAMEKHVPDFESAAAMMNFAETVLRAV